MRFIGVTLLAMSGASIFSALADTPAFAPGARSETVLGDWRIAANTAMYDRGTYEFQRGYGFLAADALVSANTEGRDELASPEVAERRAFQAVDALESGLELDPGNANAWASLAWGYARIVDDQAALEALRNSWALAPNNRVLADTRIALVGVLTDPVTAVVELTPEDSVAIKRDLESLEKYDSKGLRFHIEALPHLFEFVAS